MAENVIKEIKIGNEQNAHPIGVDWERVEGKPTFTWDSKNETLIVTRPSLSKKICQNGRSFIFLPICHILQWGQR